MAVGVLVMPTDAERDPARPHPSQHSPHLCLSLLSYRRDPGLLSLATDVLGSTRRFGSPLAVGDEFTDERSLETRAHGDPSTAEQLEKPAPA